MKYARIRIELAIPCDDSGAVAVEHRARVNALYAAIADVRTLSKRIGGGVGTIEATQTANWHVCLHEEGLPCPTPTEIGIVPVEATLPEE